MSTSAQVSAVMWHLRFQNLRSCVMHAKAAVVCSARLAAVLCGSKDHGAR